MPSTEPPGLAVRPARPEDAAALAAAHVRAWQAAYAGLMPAAILRGLDVEVRTREWEQWLADPARFEGLLVGTVDGQAAGFAVFGAARDVETGDQGELYAINVHPDRWRAGLGSALLRRSHSGLAKLGHRAATLWVVSGNVRARRFYERQGWAPEAHERTIDVGGAPVPEVRYARLLAHAASSACSGPVVDGSSPPGSGGGRDR